MTRGDEHRIADILDAAQKLADRLTIDFDTWADDEDLRLITERLVEIIGEAARAMTPEGRAAWPAVDWTGLIGLRNVLVHAYHRIQPELLWQAATVDIPAVAAELTRPRGPQERFLERRALSRACVGHHRNHLSTGTLDRRRPS